MLSKLKIYCKSPSHFILHLIGSNCPFIECLSRESRLHLCVCVCVQLCVCVAVCRKSSFFFFKNGSLYTSFCLLLSKLAFWKDSLVAQLVNNLPECRRPGLGRSPGEGKGSPLQFSGLENSMDCIVLGVTKSWTRLSDFHSLTQHVWKIIPCQYFWI